MQDICRNAGKQSYTILNSGSKAEGLDMKGSDIDLMFIDNSRDVYTDVTQCQVRGNPELFFSTKETAPGFVHIKVDYPFR